LTSLAAAVAGAGRRSACSVTDKAGANPKRASERARRAPPLPVFVDGFSRWITQRCRQLKSAPAMTSHALAHTVSNFRRNRANRFAADACNFYDLPVNDKLYFSFTL